MYVNIFLLNCDPPLLNVNIGGEIGGGGYCMVNMSSDTRPQTVSVCEHGG